ncbi:MAG: hypothetical protein OXR66_08480 [Candidatus Woesearchaeota archaeon]|nr:hypothetical protein [Candidatus Woesearchaeota archaeon]
MPTLTLAIPEGLKEEMDSIPEMNWSEVARKAITDHAAKYKVFKAIVAKSNLSEKEALAVSEKMKASMYKKYKEMMKE